MLLFNADYTLDCCILYGISYRWSNDVVSWHNISVSPYVLIIMMMMMMR